MDGSNLPEGNRNKKKTPNNCVGHFVLRIEGHKILILSDKALGDPHEM